MTKNGMLSVSDRTLRVGFAEAPVQAVLLIIVDTRRPMILRIAMQSFG